MPYRVRIKNQQGAYLQGTIYYFLSDGTEIGQTVIYPDGTLLDEGLVTDAEYLRVVAPGYGYYGTPAYTLGDDTVFTLVADTPVMLYAGIGFIAGFLLSRFLKLR